MAAFLSVAAVGGPAAATSVAFTNFRAAWVSTTAYGAGAVVTYNGASYFCLVGNTNVNPSSSATDWAILVAPGTLVDANGNTRKAKVRSVSTQQGKTTPPLGLERFIPTRPAA